MLFYQLAYRPVNRKLITTRVHAELQVIGQPKLFYGLFYYQNILFKFLRELLQIAHIINTLIKSPGKFWCDSLKLYTIIRKSAQNKEQLHRCLRVVHFIHRNFRYKAIFAFGSGNMLIQLSGFHRR